VAWHYDAKGIFSVRSAYKVHREQLRRNSRRGAGSSADGNILEKEQWKHIWKLKCPGKIKQFLWRFTHNSQAVRRNLQRKGMAELDELTSKHMDLQNMYRKLMCSNEKLVDSFATLEIDYEVIVTVVKSYKPIDNTCSQNENK